jgi:uncharacterized membrane protein
MRSPCDRWTIRPESRKQTMADRADSPAPQAVQARRGATPFPAIRPVTMRAPFAWLAAGARDLRRAPAASLFYGVAFAAMGWLIATVFRYMYEYTSALTAGFLLMGPFLCTGFYDISRRLQRGERVRLADTLTAWRANAGAFGLFAIILTVIMLVWARASLVTFALFFSSGMPTLDKFLARVVSAEHWDFVLTYFAVGGLFAAIVFATAVVSVPMMLDRGTDAVVAALTSVRALLTQTAPLLLWAGLIVLLIGAGFASLFIGLIVTAPLVGHATWHAYQALVAPAEPAAH